MATIEKLVNEEKEIKQFVNATEEFQARYWKYYAKDNEFDFTNASDEEFFEAMNFISKSNLSGIIIYKNHFPKIEENDTESMVKKLMKIIGINIPIKDAK